MIPYVTYIVGNTSVIYMIDKWDDKEESKEKCVKVATHETPRAPAPTQENERE